MKNLFLLLLVILGLGCKNNDISKPAESTTYSTEKELVFLDINHRTTEEELMKIKSEFEELNGLSLNIDSTLFDQEGRIEKLNIQIESKEGLKGSLHSDVAFKTAGFSIEKNGCLKTYVVL